MSLHRRDTLLLIVILLVAFTLRLTRLGFQELRGDEAFGYFFTQQSYSAIIDQTIALDEPHPVASYFVLKAWQGLAGHSEFALRFAGVWFGTLAVALLARLAKRLGLAPRTGLLAALLAALSPYAIWHAQDARMYAMSLALNTAVVWLAVEALARRRWQWVAAYLATAWLALHTHYFSGFVLAALTLFVVGRALVAPSARRAIIDWLMWNLLLVFAYMPWLSAAGTILAGYGGNGDSPTLAAMIPRALAVFAVGESMPSAQRVVWAVVLALACLFGALRLWLGGAATRRALWLLTCWGVLPVLLTWYGAHDRPIFNERYLIAAAPAFLLLAASSLQPIRRPRRWLNVGGGALTCLLLGAMAFSTIQYYTNPAFSRTRGWRALAAQMMQLGSGLPAHDVRYAQNYPDPTLWYYTGDMPHLVLPPAAQDGVGAARAVDALIRVGVERVVLAVQPAPTWDADGIAQSALDVGFDRVASAAQGSWMVEVWERSADALPAHDDHFGDAFRLTGAQVAAGSLTPGGVLTAQLAWQQATEFQPDPAAAVAVTLQLLGPDGALVAQTDQPLEVGPQGARAPYGILLPEALEPGDYALIVALYAPAQPGAPRLRTAAGEDHITLARFTVSAARAPDASFRVAVVIQRSYASLQNLIFSPNRTLQRMTLAALLVCGALALALLIGIVGPLVALAAAVALVGGALILADTHWGFVALAGVAFVIPFASLPVSIGFKPTFLDVALGALIFVWIFKLVIGQERELVASPIGLLVALFMLMALFSFANGLSHSAANSYLLRRFAEILLGIGLFFVTINTVRTVDELQWVTRWLLLGGFACASIAVIFYIIPADATVWVLDRLARFDYPGGAGALRWIEDDPTGTMRAIGTAVDPNVLGGMLIMVGGMLAPQLFSRARLFPRWLTAMMLTTAVVALYWTYSRSALVGLATSMGLIALLKYRRLIPLALVAGLLLLLLPQTQEYVARFVAGVRGEDLATQMRFGEYKDALTLIARYPLFGVGFTGVPDIDLYLGVSMLYLIIASNMGVIGLGLFVAVMVGYFVLFAQAWRAGVAPRIEPILLGVTAALAGVLVSGIFDHYWFNMSYPHMTVLLWLHLGLGTAAMLIGRVEALSTSNHA